MSHQLLGEAPGSDVVSSIGLVSDAASRELFRFLIAENASMRSSHASLSEQYGHVISLLEIVAGNVASTQTDIALIKARLQSPPAPISGDHYSGCYQPPVPAFVDAQSLGSSSSSSLLSKFSSSGSSSEGPLCCPFCPARHSNEKSHVQHMVRILERFESRCGVASVIVFALDLLWSRIAYRGKCLVHADHELFRRLDLQGDNDAFCAAVCSFISQYNACLASSNERGVDDGRLSNLRSFLADRR